MSVEDKAYKAKLLAMDNVNNVIEKLHSYWLKYPYLRLAQIVSNAWRKHPDYRKNPEPDIQDVFYFTDAKFLEALELLENPNESKDQRSSEG